MKRDNVGVLDARGVVIRLDASKYPSTHAPAALSWQCDDATPVGGLRGGWVEIDLATGQHGGGPRGRIETK